MYETIAKYSALTKEQVLQTEPSGWECATTTIECFVTPTYQFDNMQNAENV